MANMSYCAFENTASDLRQCLNMLQEARNNGQSLEEFIASRSSEHERRSVGRLLTLCQEILDLTEDND